MAERRGTKFAVLGATIGLAMAALTFAAPAAAHISLEQGGTHISRDGDANIKQGPCGLAGSKRGTKNIYTYAPGQKVTVTLIETIPHPSYFRFAFDNDGDDGFIEPASILPIDPARKCPTAPTDHCGASDFYNSPAVLPNMDNLNPHLAGAFNAKWSFEVTMPNIECTNCTLQVIQVMEDDGPHGPYDPTPGVGVEDIYHQCIDIVLKADDGGAGPVDAGRVDSGITIDAGRTDATTPDSGRDGSTGTAGAGGAGAAGSGGKAGSGNEGGLPTGGTGGGSGGTTGGGSGTAGKATGGTAGSGGATTTTGSGGAATGGTVGTGTAGSGTAGTGGGAADDGCGCSIIGRHSRASALAGWSLLALALVSRRRRR